jgi:hypothetical protein
MTVNTESPATFDHFQSIGFTLERPAFDAALQRAVHEGESIVAPRGDYHILHAGEGPELWVTMYRLGRRRELAGANPHFAGSARLDVLVESLARNEEFPLEGEAYVWVQRDPDDSEHGLYPFSVSLPDFDVVAEAADELPFRRRLALTGFAKELHSWPDEHAYQAAEASEYVRWQAASFVPLGLFGDATGRARSIALVNGRVIRATLRGNPLSERTFWHLCLKTYGGEIDIVAPPHMLASAPPVGGIVRATCWLSGRLFAA